MFDDDNSVSEEEITAWLQASLGEVVTPKMEEPLEKSDSEGHPFHGNQYTNGGGGDPTKDTIKSHQDQANHHDEMAANAKSDDERTAHEQAAQSHRDAAMSWRMTGSNEEGGEGAQVASDDAWADSENANAKSAVQKGDVAGHAFHGNQYQSGNVSTAYGTSYKSNGTNIIPANVGGRDFDLKTTVDQIGRMNVLAISGGKVNSVADAKGNQVGLELPVSNGYSVRVLLANDDTYTVQRCFTRGSNESVKGEQTGVYADEVGETAYQAGMFRSNNFGDHIVTKASDELISEWIEPFFKAEQGPVEVSATANEVVGVRIDDFPTEAPALEEQLVLEIPVEENPQEIEISDDVEKSADVEEWNIPVYKGGQGSGEQAGHPFRGNRWTAGTGSSDHHDDRGDKSRNHGYHLDAAASHIAAGRAAQAQGDHGAAMRHFNEAAYHASQASAKLQNPGGFTNRTLGGSAETLYHLAHDAGNASEKANFANREVTRYTRDGGNDPAELASLQKAASDATSAANQMGSTLESHAATVDSIRSQVGDPTYTSVPAPVSAPAREAQAG